MNIPLTTRELADLARVNTESVFLAHRRQGHYLGVAPIKLPNGRLLWPRDEVLALFQSAGKGGAQ